MSTDTEHILEKLVSFPTVSRDSNLEMIQYMASYLGDMGIEPTLTFNEERTKANLYAVFGPEGPGGACFPGTRMSCPRMDSTGPWILLN